MSRGRDSLMQLSSTVTSVKAEKAGTDFAMLRLVTQLYLTLCCPMDCSPLGSSVHGDSPSKNTGMGFPAFLQGIFPTQGLNPGLPHCGWTFYHLSHQGNPRILEWAASFFSRGSSWPRNWTRVSRIAGRFLTSWATREAQAQIKVNEMK